MAAASAAGTPSDFEWCASRISSPVILALLVALVLAPVGRGNQLPPDDQLSDAVEYLLPGLSGILAAHQPVFRRWPGQLSSQGFPHVFTNNVPLPGDQGKGTPWCSATGKFEYAGKKILAGLVCCAEKPNTLSQIVVEHAGRWHDVLRVHDES